jgi:hypothetical protein
MAIVPFAPLGADHPKPSEAVVTDHDFLPGANAKNDHLLVVSPYDEEPHLLDLRTLDTANQLLAKALVGLTCLRDDYATAPYVEIFNVSHPREILPTRSISMRWEGSAYFHLPPHLRS